MGWEQKLGFEAGRFTSVNLVLASMLGVLGSLFFYGGVWILHRWVPWMDFLCNAFLRPQNLWTVIPMVGSLAGVRFFWPAKPLSFICKKKRWRGR